MAVKHKTGLDYFPFDIDFFSDEKIEFVSARFGLKGEIIAVKLLCKIYRNGYFYQWGDDEALLFAKSVGDGCQHSFVNDVVHELVKRGFFDRSIFNSFKILTSRGIQSRYFEAVERRKLIEVKKELLLVDVEKYDNVDILPQNVNIMSANDNILPQSKVKESKVKESKGESGACAPTHEEKKSFKNFSEQDFIEEIGKFKDRYCSDILNSFYKYWKEKNAKGKMRFQLEQTWETALRLEKWAANQTNFNQKNSTNGKVQSTSTHKPGYGAKPTPQIVPAGSFGQL